MNNTPISLTKNQTISLVKQNGSNLSNCFVGLGWDIHRGKNADLDAFAVELDANGQAIDTIYFGHLASRDGSIIHSGDNLTGAGDGDDEVIKLNLSNVPLSVKKIVIAVNIFTANLSFSEVENAFIRLVDSNNNAEFAHYNLSAITGKYHTMYMAEFVRNENGTWDFTAIGRPTTDTSIQNFVKSITGNASSNNSTQPQRTSRIGGFFRNIFG